MNEEALKFARRTEGIVVHQPTRSSLKNGNYQIPSSVPISIFLIITTVYITEYRSPSKRLARSNDEF